jgi:hypothetical protein
MAPLVSSRSENSKKGENCYLAQEGEGHDGNRENHVIYGHRGYCFALDYPELNA